MRKTQHSNIIPLVYIWFKEQLKFVFSSLNLLHIYWLNFCVVITLMIEDYS